MNRTIQYGVDQDTGIVVSMVNGECAVPVLDFEVIGKGGDGYAPGDFRGPTRYTLEKCSIYDVYPYVKWTRKVPVKVKNLHRRFWGFKPIKEEVSAG